MSSSTVAASMEVASLMTIVLTVEMIVVGVGISLVNKGPSTSPPAVSRSVCMVPTVSALIVGVGRIWIVPVATTFVTTRKVGPVVISRMACVFCKGSVLIFQGDEEDSLTTA